MKGQKEVKNLLRPTTHPVILPATFWSLLSSFATRFVYLTRVISRGSDLYPVTVFSFISVYILFHFSTEIL